MKEIISGRYKRPYSIALALSVVSIFISASYLKVPNFKIFGIVIIAILCLASVVWIYLLTDPRGVIERDGDMLIVRRGIRKTEIKLSDVKEISKIPHLTNPGEFQQNCVSIKATVDGEEKTLICSDVENVNAFITWFYRIYKA